MATSTKQFVKAATALSAIQPAGLLNYHVAADLNKAPKAGAYVDYCKETIEAQKAFSERRTQIDLAQTEVWNRREVERLADELNNNSTKKHAAIAEGLKRETASAAERLATATHVKPSDEAGEIRTVIRGMDDAELAALVRKAFSDDDRVLIGAIVGIHHLVTGIDPELLASERDRWQQRVATAEYDSLAEYRKIQGYHDNAGKQLISWHAKSKAGTEGYAKARSNAESILRSYGEKYVED